VDLQLKDVADKKWVVKFNGGVVNNQQRDGTYHGMAVSFSGSSDAEEFVHLVGETTSPLQISILSYSGNPARVKLTWSHGGRSKCVKDAPPPGCEELDKAEGQKKAVQWSAELLSRYGQCARAWEAVKKTHPGGQVQWDSFESVWSMAWGQGSSAGSPGGAKAWQMGFATVDIDNDGYVSEAEFLKTCNLMAGIPSPAPAPAGPVPKTGPNQDVRLNTCLGVVVMDKAYWPKDPFKGTGFKDSPLLDAVIGRTLEAVSEDDKGVKVPSHPDGSQQWFFPKGTYYCAQATHGQKAADPPAPTVNTRGPAPSIANIVPILVGGAPSPDPNFQLTRAAAPSAALLEEEPDAAIENSGFLASGGHCIEAFVMVEPSSRNLRLMYQGPDTEPPTGPKFNKPIVLNGQMVQCNPVIPACEPQHQDVCKNYQPKCAPAPAMAPAPASASAPDAAT
jgi:hypothetical protein